MDKIDAVNRLGLTATASGTGVIAVDTILLISYQLMHWQLVVR